LYHKSGIKAMIRALPKYSLVKMKTPRRRDSGVSLGELNAFNNPPSPPFLKVGYRENPTAKTMGYLKFN
jgi:hypothetical protein